MNTIQYNSGFNFPELVTKVITNAEPSIVETEAGKKVVVMPLDEFTAWQETAYLLSNPANAAHLRESISQARNTNRRQYSLILLASISGY
jgi:antitoxin YefM